MFLRILYVLFLFLSLVGQVVALDPSMLSNPVDKEQWYAQWFAGPILTPQPFTLPVGHPSLEITSFIRNYNGEYDANWNFQSASDLISIQTQMFLEGAVSKRVGLYIVPSFSVNFSQGQNATFLNDTCLGFGYQILEDTPGSWIPDLRILFEEIIPTGNYRNLSPEKNGADSTGRGSFQTGLYLASGKYFKFTHPHNMTIRAVVGYFVPSAVHVQNLNYYGGGEGTDGRVRPGQYITVYFSADYSLSRQWGVGVETNVIHGNRGSFSGKRGFDSKGNKHEISVPSFTQWSMLPWVGRTFNANTALLFGSWFTLMGRNSPAFYGAVITFLHVF